MPMGNDDDDTAAHHGGGPISYVFEWLWNYRLTNLKNVRSFWLIAATHVIALIAGAAL